MTYTTTRIQKKVAQYDLWNWPLINMLIKRQHTDGKPAPGLAIAYIDPVPAIFIRPDYFRQYRLAVAAQGEVVTIAGSA